MQLGASVGVEVFSPDFTPLGPLERKTALRWLERFKSNGEFELWCPITEQNTALLVKDNIIWLGAESAGVIEYIDKERDKSSEFEFHVKGRMLECKLEGRVLHPTFNYSGQASGAMRDMVGKFCVSPEDDSRRITNLFLAELGENFGGNISYQQTGSDVLEEQIFLSEANNVGFTVAFDPFNKQYLYKVLKPIDRSWSQVENDPVVFDSASDEILDSKYTINWANGRNVAVVAGEGEGSDRIVIEVFDPSYVDGDVRKELWVDARDLQKEDSDGNTLTDDEYKELLRQRGLQRLSEYRYVESFKSTIKTFGYQQNVYGVDFLLGDIVTVIDRELGVTVNTQVTEVEQTWDSKGYQIDITFGNPQPTILDVIRREVRLNG